MGTFVIVRGELEDRGSLVGVMEGSREEVSNYVNKANESLFRDQYGCSSIDEGEWEDHNHRHDALLFMAGNFFDYKEVSQLTPDLPLTRFPA